MTLSERLQEIRTGFERPFWVANISEIFERLSYYAVFAALARYLHEALQFPNRPGSQSERTFRRRCLGHGNRRRRTGGPHRFPTRALVGLLHSELVRISWLVRSPLPGWSLCAGSFQSDGWSVSFCFCPRWALRWLNPAWWGQPRAPRRKASAPLGIRFTTRS